VASTPAGKLRRLDNPRVRVFAAAAFGQHRGHAESRPTGSTSQLSLGI
jgi:hypothetical protein